MEVVKVFGQRFCTYCGTYEMYYFEQDNHPYGICLRCGNTDYCGNETKADVLKRFGNHMKKPDIDELVLE